MDTKKISLDPSAIAWRLALVALLLVAVNLAMQATGSSPTRSTLPAWR